MLMRKFLKGLKMLQRKNNSFLDLEFKIPTEADRPPPLAYHPLSPRKYLDFISIGIEMCPENLEKAKHDLKRAPKVRFEL